MYVPNLLTSRNESYTEIIIYYIRIIYLSATRYFQLYSGTDFMLDFYLLFRFILIRLRVYHVLTVYLYICIRFPAMLWERAPPFCICGVSSAFVYMMVKTYIIMSICNNFTVIHTLYIFIVWITKCGWKLFSSSQRNASQLLPYRIWSFSGKKEFASFLQLYCIYVSRFDSIIG